MIEEFSKLFKTPIDYKNPKLPYVNVVSMSRSDLYKVQNKFIVSDKIDGERGLLFTTNNKAYILTMDKKTIYTGFEIDKQYNNSVLDGEYVFNSKYHKFIFIPYKGCNYFYHHPTTNLFVFLRYLAGIGLSNFHVTFIGFEPLCFT